MNTGSPHHRLAVHGKLGPLTFAVEIALSAPWTVLFAPSGSGKTTLLRLMAGSLEMPGMLFERHTTGGWQSLISPDTTLPPERRGLAFAPQHAHLFPHLTVADNVAFPLQVRRISGVSRPAMDAMELTGVAALSQRRPRQLSGGERQLVALARALAVPDSHLLLLDEAFAGVDRPTRDSLIPRLQAFVAARNLPVVSVTHDLEEALLLSAEVVRLQDGSVVAQGPAREVLAPELNRLRGLLR